MSGNIYLYTGSEGGMFSFTTAHDYDEWRRTGKLNIAPQDATDRDGSGRLDITPAFIAEYECVRNYDTVLGRPRT